MTDSPHVRESASVRWDWLVFGCWGLCFTCLRWWPLLLGYGFIGGDIYTYYFPLKTWYADAIGQGTIPFWNPLIGNGMPALAESQTGVFYPFNIICYGLLPVHLAYNAVFLIHTWIGHLFTSLYLRSLGLCRSACVIGSIILILGWFAPRNCLEWAMVTGAWLPVCLWMAERYLNDGRRIWCAGIATAVGLQLLAGHFHLSFVTLLLGAIYLPLRLLTARRSKLRWIRLGWVSLAVLLGFGLAAVQLVPSWHLKQLSQRAGAGTESHDVHYGNLPPRFLTQTVFPWWHYPQVKAHALDDEFGKHNTNQIEAHLYWGMASWLLALLAIWHKRLWKVMGIWLFVGGLGLYLASGHWIGWAGWLPGLSYFTGPGRYGLLTQLAMVVWAAVGFDRLVGSRSTNAALLAAALFGSTLWLDLQWAGACVQYTKTVYPAPVSLRDQSPLARMLSGSDRIISKNQNSMTLTGAAMFPVYLGIGPKEYVERSTRLTPEFGWDRPLTPAVLDWFRRAGVTHILAFEEHREWGLTPIWSGSDPMFDCVLGRLRQERQLAPRWQELLFPDMPLNFVPGTSRESFWLYEIPGSLGRAFFEGASRNGDGSRIERVDVQSNQIEIMAESARQDRLILTDLYFPGWRVEVDGSEVQPKRWQTMFRSLDFSPGRHLVRWYYRPPGFWLGSCLSLLSVALIAVIGFGGRARSTPRSPR